MPNKNNKIEYVFHPQSSKNYPVSSILKKPQKELFEIRRKLRPSVSKLSLLCSICYQPVILAGYLDQSFYFRHVKDSEECPVKTNSHFSQEEINAMKYNGQKEGRKHKENKLLIAKLLDKDDAFSNIRVEKTFRELNSTGIAKRWRRPDVAATNIAENVDVVFELQVSTTFIDVIIEREEFYKNNDVFILWVFLEFEARRFTELDIFYANYSNAFVFDPEAANESEKAGKLMLKCFYHHYEVIETDYRVSVEAKEKTCLVSMQDLTYNKESKKLYYFDSKTSEYQANKEARNIRDKRQEQEKQERLAKLAAERIQQQKESEAQIAKLNADLKRKEQEYFQEKGLNKLTTHKRTYSYNVKNKGLSDRNYNKLKSTKSFQNLHCEKCGNRDYFRDIACFIYCSQCKAEIKY